MRREKVHQLRAQRSVEEIDDLFLSLFDVGVATAGRNIGIRTFLILVHPQPGPRVTELAWCIHKHNQIRHVAASRQRFPCAYSVDDPALLGQPALVNEFELSLLGKFPRRSPKDLIEMPHRQ